MSRIEDLVQQWYVTKDAHHHVAIAQSASAAAFDDVDGTAPDKETP